MVRVILWIKLILQLIVIVVVISGCSLIRQTPTVIRSGGAPATPTGLAADLPNCFSLTPSATAEIMTTRTATPNQATQDIYRQTPPPPMPPTWTPLPLEGMVDLAPGFPNYSKYQVVVHRGNGTNELWELGLWMSEEIIPRERGDCQDFLNLNEASYKTAPPHVSRTAVPDPPRSVSLDHNHSASAVLLEITSPSFSFFNYTNTLANYYYLPTLRIFGDGHGYYLDPQRGLLAGNIDYHPILNWLFGLHFFDPWVNEMVAPAPPATEISVYLNSGTFSRGYYQKSGLIQQVLTMIKPDSLMPYIPKEAVLHAQAYAAYLPGGFPEWPAAVSFSPEDIQYSNFTARRADLAAIWKGLEAQQTPVKGFNYKGRNWAVWMTIPGLMNDKGGCNPASIPTPIPPQPTSTWFAYPEPVTPSPATPVLPPYPYPVTSPTAVR